MGMDPAIGPTVNNERQHVAAYGKVPSVRAYTAWVPRNKSWGVAKVSGAQNTTKSTARETREIKP